MMKHSKVKEDFKSPYMKKIAERLNVLKMTKAERKIYQAYRNESLKERDYIVSAEEKGREEGREKGIEIGEARGEKKAIVIAKNLLKAGLSNNLIAESTGLSVEEIAKLKH